MSSTTSLLLFLRMVHVAPKSRIAGWRLDRSFSSPQGYLSSSHPVLCYSRRSMMTSGKDDKEKKKSNFDRDVLLPASRGELAGDKPHTSGIPKLAARRNKAHLGPISRSSGLSELYDKEFMDESDDIFMNDGIRRRKGSPYQPSLRNHDDIVLDRTGAYTSIDQMLQEDDGATFTEEDWHEMDRLLQQATRDVAEVAIAVAAAQKHGEPEPEKEEAILKRLKDTEQKMAQKAQRFIRMAPLDDTDDDRRLKSKVTERFACTYLPRGIRRDGSASMDALRPTQRKEENEASAAAVNQNSLLMFDPNYDFEDFNIDENGAMVPQRETEETRMIQRDAILAYARTLDLDREFGYWCEMDYDTDPQAAEILEAKHIEELNQHAKEEAEKKAALAKILEEVEGETEDDTSTEVAIEEGESSVPEVKLTEAQQKEMDFVTWFCKENDILEYENDPTLVAAEQLKNNPRLRKKLQEQQLSGPGGDVLNTLTADDERDLLYGDHPQSIELCSGTDEYIEVDSLHPHQKREPKPYFRMHTQQPDLTFVDTYKRFAYIANLPPLFLESTNPNQRPKSVDLNNPVDRTLFQRYVSRLFRNVELDQVFPASTTSAWIGYRDSVGLAETLVFGPDDDILKAQEEKIPKPSFEPLPEKLKEHKFVMTALNSDPEADKCIVLLSQLDATRGKRYTSTSLARDLFASKALAARDEEGKTGEDIENVLDVASVYGNVAPADIVFLNSSSALVRLASPEQAASVLDSSVLQARLAKLNYGGTPIQVLRARRELVHRGWNRKHGTDIGKDEVRKLGPRLMVDSDMPTKLFYTSHAGVIMLSGVDPHHVSKHEISKLVQPYCDLGRDSEGSIEWVECNHSETRTDRVYVGFDLVGDAEKAAKALGAVTHLMSTGSDEPAKVFVKLLRDRQPPNYPLPALQRRPDRSTEELLLDLNHWEQHVDPADVQYLEENGISKHVLDESLRAIRFNNDTFGPLDYAMRTESLEPYKSTGEQYRELVRLYIDSLKQCLATPENPGKMFELLQYPNQEVDLEIFEHEAARLEKIKEERSRA